MSQFPPWLKRRITVNDTQKKIRGLLRELNLRTVCENALCPNLAECWGEGELTFMILGNCCTRDCKFCAVPPWRDKQPLPPDLEEPRRIAQAAKKLSFKHIIVTSVTRDDLEDGGARYFVETIRQLRQFGSGVVIEVLIPDFQGEREAIEGVTKARPDIIGHNLETVPRLYKEVRPQASYDRSVKVLKLVKSLNDGIYTKSGLMLGLGETRKEVLEVLADLREVDCDILTLGQYLRPSKRHLEVKRFVPPEEFGEYKATAEEMGFLFVAAGPWVRSSYKSSEFSKRFINHEFHELHESVIKEKGERCREKQIKFSDHRARRVR